MTNPTKFTWTVPTTNVDGSPIAAGEIIGYAVGIRDVNLTPTPGTYTTQASVLDPTATSVAIPSLPVGDYAAAAMTIGTPNSAYGAEITFSIAAVAPPVPNAPSGLAVA